MRDLHRRAIFPGQPHHSLAIVWLYDCIHHPIAVIVLRRRAACAWPVSKQLVDLLVDVVGRGWPERARLVNRKPGCWDDVLRHKRSVSNGRWERGLSYRVGVEENARERVVQIAPGGDEHAARGWRQTSVADDLKEGDGESATGRVAAYDDVAGFDGSVRGSRWRLDEEEVWK